MSAATSLQELKVLISSCHPIIVIETVEEERVRSLLGSVAAHGWLPVFEWSAARGFTKLEDTKSTQAATADPRVLFQHLGAIQIEAIFLLKDFSRYLEDPQIARQFRELAQRFSGTRSTMVLTGETVKLPAEIEAMAVRVPLSVPTREELRYALDALLQSAGPLTRLAIRLSEPDKEAVLRAVQGMTLNQARQAIVQVLLEDGKFSPEDLGKLLHRKSQAIREGGLLEYYPVEDNKTELGGFPNLKAWLDRAKLGFSEEAREMNLPAPKGVLLVGVQGCGKSLAAKSIARQWKMPLLKLDAGRLFDKFIGESEKNFRKAIELAESMSPCVLWIDEIEKGMAPTGSSESDGGLSRRLFGSFLTWLQEKKQEVFVVATANDLLVLPPELLRKGRFDEIFFVDLPTPEERTEIFKIHLGLRKQEPRIFDLTQLVAASEGFSGAEIEQVVVAGCYRALHQKKSPDTAVFLEEIRQTKPLSVTRAEDIQRLRENAKGRFVPVR